MFGAPVISGSYSEVTLKIFSSRQKEISHADSGTQQCPGHINVTLDPMSDSGRWLSFSDTSAIQQTAMFNLIGAAATVVDITLEFQLSDQTVAVVHPLTVAAATVGTLYWNYLDNTTAGAATAGNTNLIPLGSLSTLAAFG